MSASIRDLVRHRAENRCEYCRVPQVATPLIPFRIEHIIAKQHATSTTNDPDELALSCDRCNAFKGPNLTSIDPETGEVIPLFNPRRQSWTSHFAMNGAEIVGLTPTGRATAR